LLACSTDDLMVSLWVLQIVFLEFFLYLVASFLGENLLKLFFLLGSNELFTLPLGCFGIATVFKVQVIKYLFDDVRLAEAEEYGYPNQTHIESGNEQVVNVALEHVR